MILAEAIPYVGETGQLVLGIVGLLTVGLLVMKFAQAAKQLFGRTPPFHTELDKRDKALRKMIFASEANMKERIAAQAQQIVVLTEEMRDLQLDRQRKWEELKKEYSSLRSDLSFIRGKFERQPET